MSCVHDSRIVGQRWRLGPADRITSAASVRTLSPACAVTDDGDRRLWLPSLPTHLGELCGPSSPECLPYCLCLCFRNRRRDLRDAEKLRAGMWQIGAHAARIQYLRVVQQADGRKSNGSSKVYVHTDERCVCIWTRSNSKMRPSERGGLRVGRAVETLRSNVIGVSQTKHMRGHSNCKQGETQHFHCISAKKLEDCASPQSLRSNVPQSSSTWQRASLFTPSQP